MRHRIILNPVAGKGKALDLRPQIESAFVSSAVAFDIVHTEGVMDAARLAQQAAADGYDSVVVAGGDGTCNEVVNGLMRVVEAGGTPPALGILPVGRGNDFAHGVGIPKELSAAIAVVTAGETIALDVGKVTGGFYPQGRYFGNGIGVGFDTIVGLEAAKLRRVRGFAAYVVGAVRTFVRFPDAPRVSLSVDGTVSEVTTHQISILNGRRMGGTFFMAPEAEVGDGLLDLCMTNRPLRRGEMARMILRYTRGTQAECDVVSTGRGRTFVLDAPEGGLICHADGETICTDGTYLKVTTLPAALSVFSASPAGNSRDASQSEATSGRSADRRPATDERGSASAGPNAPTSANPEGSPHPTIPNRRGDETAVGDSV